MSRKLLIGAVALFGIVAIAAVVAVALVDVNRFKPRIEQFVHERYQRSLHIDGDLSLSIFPRLAVTLPAARLSERGRADEAARITGARVSVALLPLLRGELVAESAVVDGLRATVERRADGSLNIDDLIRPAPPPSPAGAPQPPESSRRFDIGAIRLSNAQLAYRDRLSGRAVAVSGLDLSLGSLSNAGAAPLTAAFSFDSSRPAARGEVRLNAQARFDFAANVFGLKDLDVTASASGGASRADSMRLKLSQLTLDAGNATVEFAGLDLRAAGRAGAGTFDAAATLPQLAVTQTQITAPTLHSHVKLIGARATELRIDAAGIGGKRPAVSIARLSIDASTAQGPRTIQATPASPLQADLASGKFDLPSVAGSVAIADPRMPAQRAAFDVNGSAA
ncbi:MAG TPA: AsmA family protein, partial [Burkholderiaceae bacterium]|nr:AsmA family protein [Burkholderiaceae bacterium]